jgi:hypothetical protein
MQSSLLQGGYGDGHLVLGGDLRHAFTIAVKEWASLLAISL